LDYSIALSRQRDWAGANRLIQRGIEADRLLTSGEGLRDPGQEEGLSRDEERMVGIRFGFGIYRESCPIGSVRETGCQGYLPSVLRLMSRLFISLKTLFQCLASKAFRHL
jgi:hypothetical protein